MDKLILAVVCFVFSVVFFTGRGADLIEGKKDPSEVPKAKGSNTAVSKTVAIVLLGAGACFLAMYLFSVFLPKYSVPAQSIAGLILVLLGIFSIVFINKSPRFKG